MRKWYEDQTSLYHVSVGAFWFFLDEKANHGYLTYFYGLNSHFLNAGDSVAQPRA